jgi:hypothetical protein
VNDPRDDLLDMQFRMCASDKFRGPAEICLRSSCNHNTSSFAPVDRGSCIQRFVDAPFDLARFTSECGFINLQDAINDLEIGVNEVACSYAYYVGGLQETDFFRTLRGSTRDFQMSLRPRIGQSLEGRPEQRVMNSVRRPVMYAGRSRLGRWAAPANSWLDPFNSAAAI